MRLHLHLIGSKYVDKAEPMFSNWEMEKVKFLYNQKSRLDLSLDNLVNSHNL